MKKIKVSNLKDNIEDEIFYCDYYCTNCIFFITNNHCVGHSYNYDFNAIKNHNFKQKEITIRSLKQFKLQ